MNNIANHLMGVVYLQQKIEYLEKAISVFLEEHHLKGIYLTRVWWRKEIEKVKCLLKKQKLF